jgi:alkylhydroperoxidase family enzyme
MRIIDAIRQTILEVDGALDREVRRRVFFSSDVPPELASYVEKVHRFAHRVTDEDVAALKAHGYTEDQIFEVTLAAACGAGFLRLDAGRRALQKEA